MRWVLAARALREDYPEGRGARNRVPPVLSALRAEVEMSASTRSQNRLRGGLWKTPGTAHDEIVQTPTCVVPFSVAHVAVVRVQLSGQQVGPPAAHWTFRRADDREVSQNLIVGGDLAGGRARAGVLPSMTGCAPVRMLDAGTELDGHRVRGRHAEDLHAPHRRWARAASPDETPPPHHPAGRA
jgi:hypothetical protein